LRIVLYNPIKGSFSALDKASYMQASRSCDWLAWHLQGIYEALLLLFLSSGYNLPQARQQCK